MTRYKDIMVAVDFSDHSLASFRHGATLAEDLGARLHLVNVINQRDVDMMKLVADKAPAFNLQQHLNETIQDREASFKHLVDTSNVRMLAVSFKVRIGQPFVELLKEIEEKKPDLMVMGAKGRSNLIETVMGSCAQRMFRRCPVPLLIIR